MQNTISRTAQCQDCGVYGTWVDTTSGEILEHGEVIGRAMDQDEWLMVDADGMLRCAHCNVKKGERHRLKAETRW